MKDSRKFALLLAGCLALSGLQAAAPKPFLDDPLPVQAYYYGDEDERPTLGDPNGKIVTIGEIQYKIITDKIDGKSVKHARVYQLTYPRGNWSQYIVPEDTEVKGEVVIPSTVQGVPVTQIHHGAFRGCTQITSVVLPETMEWIGDRAFCDCTGLTSVHLNEGLKMIEGCAFQNCDLTSVVIPPNADMYEEVFEGCTNLEKVTFEDSDRDLIVPPYCFADCTSLKEVNLGIHNSLQIERYAFLRCSALEEITIPPITRSNRDVCLNRCLFKGCESLKTVSVLAKCSGEYFYREYFYRGMIYERPYALFMAEQLEWDELGTEILSILSYVQGVTVRGIPDSTLQEACKNSKIKFEPLTESELELIAAAITTTAASTTTTMTTTATTATTTITSATAEVPETTTVTETAEVPETTTVTETAEVPETTTVTETTEAPETTTVTETTEAPETTTVTETTEAPETTTVTETTEAPETTTVTETTEAPETNGTTVTTTIPDAPRIAGDVNGNGVTDVSDAVMLARFVAEDQDIRLSAAGKRNADSNGDGEITGDDVITILRIIAKLIR